MPRQAALLIPHLPINMILTFEAYAELKNIIGRRIAKKKFIINAYFDWIETS